MLDPSFLEPVDRSLIVARVLGNLRSIYAQQGDRAALEWVLLLRPADAAGSGPVELAEHAEVLGRSATRPPSSRRSPTTRRRRRRRATRSGPAACAPASTDGRRRSGWIDRDLKRWLGQMMKGVQVVGAADDGVARRYCSHWVCQVSFEEPIVLASVSPKHDTHPLIVASGPLRGVDPRRRPGRRGPVLLLSRPPVPLPRPTSTSRWSTGCRACRNCVAWLRLRGLRAHADALDHDLFLARVVGPREGRLGEPPLLYSSRLGWRVTGERAREPGDSIRDRLLARGWSDEAGRK